MPSTDALLLPSSSAATKPRPPGSQGRGHRQRQCQQAVPAAGTVGALWWGHLAQGLQQGHGRDLPAGRLGAGSGGGAPPQHTHGQLGLLEAAACSPRHSWRHACPAEQRKMSASVLLWPRPTLQLHVVLVLEVAGGYISSLSSLYIYWDPSHLEGADDVRKRRPELWVLHDAALHQQFKCSRSALAELQEASVLHKPRGRLEPGAHTPAGSVKM